MIRVITIQEPWASLIGERIKIIETRSWPCKQYGELYIHAGLSKILKSNTKATEAAALLKGELHYGSIFAKCTLSDCVLITEEFAQKIKESDPNCFYVAILHRDVMHGCLQTLNPWNQLSQKENWVFVL